MSAWAAVAQVAGQTFNMLYDKQQQDQQHSWDKQVYADQKAREDNKYQRAVIDAKAAGLHPLFALGTSGAGSRSISFPGRTGSYAGQGLANIGNAIGNEINRREGEQKAQAAAAPAHQKAGEVHALTTEKMRGEIDLDQQQLFDMKLSSDLKMQEQRAMWGSPDTGIGGDTKLTPFGEETLPTELRPTVMHANLSFPEFIELVGKHGGKMYGLNPDAGMDEIGQAYYVYKKFIAELKPRSVGNRKRFTSYWSTKTTGLARGRMRSKQIARLAKRASRANRARDTYNRWKAPPRRHP